MHAESRSGVGHHVFDTVLVHGYDVGISFHHIHFVFLSNSPFGLEQSVELMVFVVDVRLRRVNILLLYSLCTRVEQSSAKGVHFAADANPREDDSSGKSVYEFAVVFFIAQSGLYEIFFFVAFLLRFLSQGVSSCQGEP